MSDCTVGLLVLPSLLPPLVQVALLDKLLHRDLSNPAHQTNLHLHHHISYPESTIPNMHGSFFSQKHETVLRPKDPSVHRDLYMREVLEKRLRWLTLGGQYDWTAKEYPIEKPPAFPEDIAELIRQLFPFMEPQAAILNFYAPGDNLSIHRDVAESCDRGLVSLSIGCDAIFLVSGDDVTQAVAIRLRSGDAVAMTGESRYAWHAVPKVIPGTSPTYLADWPATSATQGKYDEYQGYMINKRINLNIRQMSEYQSDVIDSDSSNSLMIRHS